MLVQRPLRVRGRCRNWYRPRVWAVFWCNKEVGHGVFEFLELPPPDCAPESSPRGEVAVRHGTGEGSTAHQEQADDSASGVKHLDGGVMAVLRNRRLIATFPLPAISGETPVGVQWPQAQGVRQNSSRKPSGTPDGIASPRRVNAACIACARSVPSKSACMDSARMS